MPLQRHGGRGRLPAAGVAVLASASLLVVLLVPATATPAAAHQPVDHRVAPGDTLWEIARRHGVTVDQLARRNGIADPHWLPVGRVLSVGAPASGPTRPSGATHRVVPGETLSHVAVRYGSSVRALAAVNGMADADRLRAGATLRIPTGRSAPPVGTGAEVPRDRVEALLADAAARFGWDADLIKALAWQESGWSNTAVSSADARGIMQVLPSTNRTVSEPRAGRPLDLSDPVDNIEAGMHYLELVHDLTGGDPEAILAGYYQGLRSVSRNGRYPSTERYIANVLALRDRFAGRG